MAAKRAKAKAEEVDLDKVIVSDGVRAHDVQEAKEVAHALAVPFEDGEVKWKPQHISGNRALVVAFVDARVIQDRLDDVLGVMGWQDSYECLPDGTVVCRLMIRVGDEWITKMDVGGQSEQPDEGDRRKAAVSDALKRAAVKFGIGRYLYRLPQQWVDYDPQKKKLLQKPVLPDWARPPLTEDRPELGLKEQAPKEQPAKAADKPANGPEANGKEARAQREAAPTVKMTASPGEAKPSSPERKPPTETKPVKGMPVNGAELQRRLYDKDEALAREGVCKAGELVKHIVQAGVQAGYEADLATWVGPAILLAVEQTKAFETRVRQSARPMGARKEVA